ncbi:ABC transporter permease [Streptomyces sp. NBC_00696]|uniref:ABC transporter permease n=1 Tax=Streptomyces sp. NBC_00696 TaxID=2903672 RepID=UPI002E317882|nr:iron ABC transporter permease [Streptomyces sp. NBC_00696]
MTWLVVVLGVLVPIVPLLYASVRDRPVYEAGGVFTLSPYRQLFADPAFWQSVRNTLEFATLCTVFAVGLGAGAAIACARTDILGRRLWSKLLLAPLLLPPLGVILGWNALYGPGGYATNFITHTLRIPLNLTSVPGMSALGSVVGMPVAFLTCQAALANVDSSLEDAARSAGARPLRVITLIVVPMMRPALLNAALLIFTLSVESLGIALILGSPAGNDFVASYLYNTWSSSSTIDPGAVSAGAMLLLLAAVGLLLLRRALLGSEARFVSVTGRGRGLHTPIELGRPRRVILGALVAAYFAVTTLAPILALALQSSVSVLTPLIAPWHLWTAANWNQIGRPEFTGPIRNSLEIAAVGAVVTTAVVALATTVAHRSSFPLRKSLQFIMLFPRAMPGIIVGIGFFWTFVLFNPPGNMLRNSIWGIALALSIRSLTLAYLVLYPALAAVSSSLDDAARSAGASWWTTMTRIVLPILRPALLASFILLFVSILNDYDPALFLVSPGNEIMGVTMINSLKQGSTGPAAAMAMVQVAATIVAIAVGSRLFRTTTRRTHA